MNRPEVWVGPQHDHRGVGFFVLIVLLFALAALVGYVVARFAAGRAVRPAAAGPAAGADEPLALLRLRYARGEIDRETFLQTSADLGGLPPPAAA